jgi:hypothetical protein
MSLHVLPTTIDGVIERLDAIVEDSIANASRLGYFAALYNRVTMAVRDGVGAGAFDDNPRMERLDVIFANRYILAYDQFRRGDRPSRAWQLAFEATTRLDLSVLQHLLLGMNAHINLDLGVAAAEVAPGSAIDTLQADFNRINSLLATLQPLVEDQLGEISPRLVPLTDVAQDLDQLDTRVGNFSMEKARRGAWAFALRLARIDSPLAREAAIVARDAQTAVVGLTCQVPGPLTQFFCGADRSDIAAHVRVLSRRGSTLPTN